jgi:hypothetical protein
VHDDEQAALARLCDQLPELRREMARFPTVRQLLADIETEARAGRPIRGLLSELSIDPDENTRQLTPLPGVGPGRASEERFGCPEDLCDRSATPAPAGALPRCWLTGRFMTRRSG